MAAEVFELSRPVHERPLGDWKSIWVELLGSETRFVHGPRWRHRVIEAGAGGEPLVLMHGIGGHAEAYARNICNLAANGFHVISIDLLHHGLTDKQPYDDATRIDLQAEALADVITGMEWASAHVAGESLGAIVAYEFAERFPEQCRKVILNTGFPLVNTRKKDFAAAGPTDGAALEELKELSVRSVEQPTFDVVRKRVEWLMSKPERATDELVDLRLRLYQIPEVHASMRDIFFIGREWLVPRIREEEDIATFKHPTLVFWTEHNPQQGTDYGEYVAGLVPGAKFYNMKDAGHWPQWEHPEEHDQVLIDFLLG